MLKYLICLLFFLPVKLASDRIQPIRYNKPVYAQIVKNNPNINKLYAKELSVMIAKVATSYKIDPIRLAAILAQESMYKVGAINKKSKDYGIAQIHHATAVAYGFDINKLKTNPHYCIEAAAIILKDIKQKYGKREKDYWTRYHSYTPEKRKEYKLLVARYMK